MTKDPVGTLRLTNKVTGAKYVLYPRQQGPRFIPASKTNGMKLVKRNINKADPKLLTNLAQAKTRFPRKPIA